MPDLWCIYHIKNCRHTRPSPKSKLVAIVCRDSKAMGFLINSNVHPLIQKRHDLLACQAYLESASHPCLNYDSYVDCIDLYEFEDAELTNKRGAISERAKEEIMKAVTNSKTIEKRYKKLILALPL